VHDGGRVVLGVAARAQRIPDHGGAQRIAAVGIGARHGAIGNGLQAGRGAGRVVAYAHVHAQPGIDMRHARILAYRPARLRAQLAVDQQLQQRVPRRRPGLGRVRGFQRLHEIRRMRVADGLQGLADAGLDIAGEHGAHGGGAYCKVMPACLTTPAQRCTSLAVWAWKAVGA
jgi:hypothetical protein